MKQITLEELLTTPTNPTTPPPSLSTSPTSTSPTPTTPSTPTSTTLDELDKLENELTEKLEQSTKDYLDQTNEHYNDDDWFTSVTDFVNESLSVIATKRTELLKASPEAVNKDICQKWKQSQIDIWSEHIKNFNDDMQKWQSKYSGCFLYPVEATDELLYIRSKYYYFVSLLTPNTLNNVFNAHIKKCSTPTPSADMLKKLLNEFNIDDYRSIIVNSQSSPSSPISVIDTTSAPVDNPWPNPVVPMTFDQVHKHH